MMEKNAIFAYPYIDEELATMRNVAGEIKGSEAAMQKKMAIKKLAIHYDYEIQKMVLAKKRREKSEEMQCHYDYEGILMKLR